MKKKIIKAYSNIDMEETGRKMKRIMACHGHNGVTLSGVLECNSQAVYKWLSGKTLPSIEHLITFCKMFGVSIDDIVSYKYVEDSEECDM